MSFERRVTFAAAAAVAVAVLLAALASYFIVRQELHHAVDRSLENTLAADRRAIAGYPGHVFAIAGAGRPPGLRPLRLTRSERLQRLLLGAPNRLDESGVVEAVYASGKVQRASGVTAGETVAATAQLVALAHSGGGSTLFTTQAGNANYRVIAAGVAPGTAIVIERSLSEDDTTLFNLRLILLVVAAIGIALAALLGWFVARTTLAPVRRLTAAAEHVAATNDLAARIEDDGRRDEIGSLAHSFNAMLGALEGTMGALDESARAQRQLIADASHELRTPVTSLRTNIEILERSDDLAPDERQRLINDLVIQLEGLSDLVGDLIELARDDEQATDTLEDVRFDILVGEAIERVRLYAPEARFDVELEETLVSAVPSRLDRAVSNLLENAVKYAGTTAPIEVRLAGGELTIRDHGPGIEPDELSHIFDRFFRGARSRSLPGSGLGLAIVRQVVERHAGTVSAAPAPGGGTVVALRIPVLS